MGKGERGASRLKTLLWVLGIGALFYIGAKLVSPYFANYQLEDKMRDEAKFAHANRRTQEELRDNIYREAQTLDIPIRRDEIRVEYNPVAPRISADYTVTVDLQVYQLPLRLHATSVR